jgi:hypothetical protein
MRQPLAKRELEELIAQAALETYPDPRALLAARRHSQNYIPTQITELLL